MDNLKFISMAKWQSCFFHCVFLGWAGLDSNNIFVRCIDQYDMKYKKKSVGPKMNKLLISRRV